jgi:streptogramin lyase
MREGTGAPHLVRIDPTTNEVLATIELPDRLCQGMVASDDAIWVCAADGLVRVDPATDTIASTVPVELASAFYRLAFGGGRVWALGSDSSVGDTVVALDPATGSTTRHPAGGSVTGLTYAFDALWLAIPGSGSVVRLDPVSGETRELVAGLPSPTQITAGADSLWVTLHGGEEDEAAPGDPQVARIDPATGEVVTTFSIGGSPRGGVDVLAGEQGVWVRGTRPWLVRIDPATNTVTATYDSEPDIHAIQGPLTEAFGSIWTVNIEEDTVYRLKP